MGPDTIDSFTWFSRQPKLVAWLGRNYQPAGKGQLCCSAASRGVLAAVVPEAGRTNGALMNAKPVSAGPRRAGRGRAVCFFIAARSAWRTTRRGRLRVTPSWSRPNGTPDPKSAPDPERAYVSVAEFRDRDGRCHRVKARVAHYPPAHAIGARIRVSYDPGAPADADFVMDGRALASLVLLGAFLATIGLLIMWNIWIGAFTVT
jgi:hypothetical protein